jgi:hypothetical protein
MFMQNFSSLACTQTDLDKFLTFLLATYMEYEGSLGFVSRKMIFFISDFNVLGIFMAKKHDLSEKKFSVCHAPLPLSLNAKFVPRLQPRP